MVDPSRARDILSSIGWLARQPKKFQAEIFQRGTVTRHAPGEIIYRMGDPLGGIYGIVSGAAIATVAPPAAPPHLLHVIATGGWVGETSFLSRESRRIGLQAAIETQTMHLPLDAMDQIASQDPTATRRFMQILMINLDILIKAFYDLQDPDEHRRIALALRRVAALENTPIPLTQAAIGMLSNASRKTVNAALQRFADTGWVKTAYRSITVTNLKGLCEYAEGATD